MASVLTRSAQFGPRSEQGACKLALSTASLRIAENTFAAIGRDRWQASLGVGEVNLLASTSNEDERSRPNGPDREQQKSNCLWGGRTNQETQRRLTRGSSRRGPFLGRYRCEPHERHAGRIRSRRVCVCRGRRAAVRPARGGPRRLSRSVRRTPRETRRSRSETATIHHRYVPPGQICASSAGGNVR
jgi:hypothetical protein